MRYKGVDSYSIHFGYYLCVWGGLASSAWHIDQMGQPPRLGCLGMCTGQCAVVDVNSKCWRNMLEPGGALEARRKASEALGGARIVILRIPTWGEATALTRCQHDASD